MTTHQKENRCPKCQAPVPPEAPQGLCPRCVLAAVSAPTESGAGSQPKSLPPLELVAAAFPQLEILEMIGRGGMGIVYKARQPKLDRFVALKILPQGVDSDPAFTERFNREGRLLARLSHPNIVTVHDFGQSQGFYYLILEYVDGVNLRQAMRAARFTPMEALALVPKICEALQYAHDEGVLHRDIKPENILLDTRGRVKIADFGIAKLAGDEKKDDNITSSGAALGTPHYMAPEQIEHPGEVDHRADIYSLGVVFYEMLTGELPIGRFAPPSAKNPVDPRLDDVVLRALEKERERRYQSANEVKTQVEMLATDLGSQSSKARAQEPITPSHQACLSAPPWINRLGILFTVLGLVAFLPASMSFGKSIQVWHSGTLMTLTGIALLTLQPRWRMAGLIGNCIGLAIGAASLLAFFLMQTVSQVPPDWQLGVAGIPDSEGFAIVMALLQTFGFVAGIWVLCRPDVKALFVENTHGSHDRHIQSENTTSRMGGTIQQRLNAPPWIKQLGFFYLALAGFEMMRTLAFFFDSPIHEVRVVLNGGPLLIPTGIALITLNRRWRIVGLCANVFALFLCAVGGGVAWVVMTNGALPPGWHSDFSGIFTLKSFYSLTQTIAFIVGIWVLCRADVKALCGVNAALEYRDESKSGPPTSTGVGETIKTETSQESRVSRHALLGGVLVILSLMSAVSLFLGYYLTATLPSVEKPFQEPHPILQWFIPGALFVLTLASGISGTILGAMALKKIRCHGARLRGSRLALSAAMCWPILMSIGAALLIGHAVNSSIPAHGEAFITLSLMISILAVISAAALFAEWLWRWAKGALQIPAGNSNLQQQQRAGSVAWWTLVIFGGPVLVAGLFYSGFYFSKQTATLNSSELPDQSLEPTQNNFRKKTKSIFLKNLKIDNRNITVPTDSFFLPGESVVALIKRSDGRMEESLTSTYTVRRNSGASTSSIFTWQVPESFGVDLVRSSNIEMQRFEGRELTLVEGKPTLLFKVRNGVGGVLEAFIELMPVTASPRNAYESTRATVRFTSVTNAQGILIAFFSPNLPPGQDLQAVGISPGGNESETHTYTGRSPLLNNLTCRWNFPTEFSQESIFTATEQMQRLKENGDLFLNPGERQLVFAVTNNFSAVFRGYLELTAPNSASRP